MSFMGTDGSEIKHRILWQQLEKLAVEFSNVRIIKIKVHKGKGPLQKGNEQTNKFAKEAALTGTLWEHMPVAVTSQAQVKQEKTVAKNN